MRSFPESTNSNDRAPGGVALAVVAVLGLLGSLWLLVAVVRTLAPMARGQPSTVVVSASSESRCDATRAPIA